ncbi:MAG: ATPase domain-containing protein [Ignisphaera sp.]|uniref:KaiC domain-containing protein n=1 Tax=Ignisphaera aggregans TaxID=334771 RepID=A0A7J3MY38_9CREN
MSNSYVFGVKELDDVLADTPYPGSMVVVAGHPGSGKTTLASTICYANTLKGHKCLYISFQEPREKLYRTMKKLGIDLEEQEKQNMLKYLWFPVVKGIEEIVEVIDRSIHDLKPSVIVVDSVNVLFTYVSDPDRRAWLQNYFYQLPRFIECLSILVAELPFGEEKLSLGGIEFVADIILILKHRISVDRLVRYMEIRKARGAPIRMALFPFQIVEGRGLRIFVPPVLKEITVPKKCYHFLSPVLTNVFEEVCSGEVILTIMSPYIDTLYPLILVFDIAIANNLKLLFMSYKYSVDELQNAILKNMTRFGLSSNVIEEFCRKRIVFDAVNPYTFSLEELLMGKLDLVDSYKPDILTIHGLEMLKPIIDENPYRFFSLLANLILYLKKMGVVTFLMLSDLSKETTRMFAKLSDTIIRLLYIKKSDVIVPYIYLFKRGLDPKIYRVDVENYLKEFSKSISCNSK